MKRSWVLIRGWHALCPQCAGADHTAEKVPRRASPAELSALTFQISAAGTGVSSHMWLLSAGTVASETEELRI